MGCLHGYKFQDEITHYLYELTLIHGQDDEAGDCQETGSWSAVFYGAFDVLADAAMSTEVIASLDADDVTILTTCAGAILTEDDQGGVYSEIYTDPEALKAKWSEIVDEAVEAYGPADDDITTSDELTWYQDGKVVVSITRAELDADSNAGRRAVMAYQERSGFYPNVWIFTDHGNAYLLTLSEE